MSLNCTDDQYYDDVVRECSPCSELCKDRSITAYLDKLEKEREPPKIQSHDLQQVNMDNPADVDQPLEEEEAQSGPLTPAGIAGVVVAGVVLLVIVVRLVNGSAFQSTRMP
nr:hypothetical protein BaRGS_032629 [Batillaria attramentaria]